MLAIDSPALSTLAPVLICFSHLRWDFVWQRPQHLLTRAARTCRVILVEEPVEEDVVAPRMAVSERDGGVRVACPKLPRGMAECDRIEAQRRLVADLLAREAKAPRIFWYYTPAALAFTDDLPRDVTVYDNMDELSAFHGASPDLLGAEERLLRRADVVFTGGVSLYEAKRHRHHNIHAVPSSIDAHHFLNARRPEHADPSDQAPIPRPRVGYFGVIDERMDMALLDAVAEHRQDWQFVMLGPVVKIDPASLPMRPNIHWLGSKPYARLPSYLAHWDAGLMPFAINEATRFISPTKTPEFLAAGVPVVSTPIRDVVRPYGEKGLVAIAAKPDHVVDALQAIIARPWAEHSAWLHEVDEHVSAGSWDRTWEGMGAIVAQALARRTSTVRRRASGASVALRASVAATE